VSWWGRKGSSSGDSQGWVGDDTFLFQLLGVRAERTSSVFISFFVIRKQAASNAGIKIALHLEPYAGRSVASVRLDLEHIYSILLDRNSVFFGLSASLLKTPCACDAQNMCPVIFVYDSYRLQPSDWQQLFGTEGGLRCGSNDVFAIALWLDADGGEQAFLTF
jgi:hypothetical protein